MSNLTSISSKFGKPSRNTHPPYSKHHFYYSTLYSPTSINSSCTTHYTQNRPIPHLTRANCTRAQRQLTTIHQPPSSTDQMDQFGHNHNAGWVCKEAYQLRRVIRVDVQHVGYWDGLSLESN